MLFAVIGLMPADSSTQLHKITFSTALVRDENGEIMSIVWVFRELADANGKRSAGDEVVKEVVEELAERLRAALQVKADRNDKDDKREERKVG